MQIFLLLVSYDGFHFVVCVGGRRFYTFGEMFFFVPFDGIVCMCVLFYLYLYILFVFVIYIARSLLFCEVVQFLFVLYAVSMESYDN